MDPNASGKHTVTTEIRTTTYDPETGNNSASVEKTLSGTFVRAPYFPGVTRDIVEHAVAGAHAGDPVAAVSPDGRDLTYTLTGRCHEWFQVHPHGQIVLAANKTLDYDKQWEFPLTLHVSDGVNTSGAADTTIDDSMPVTIRVLDSPDDRGAPDGELHAEQRGPGGPAQFRHQPSQGHAEDQHYRLGGQPADWGDSELFLVARWSLGPVAGILHQRLQSLREYTGEFGNLHGSR